MIDTNLALLDKSVATPHVQSLPYLQLIRILLSACPTVQPLTGARSSKLKFSEKRYCSILFSFIACFLQVGSWNMLEFCRQDGWSTPFCAVVAVVAEYTERALSKYLKHVDSGMEKSNRIM